MISDLAPNTGLSRKLSPKFKGPYRVVKQASPLHYKLKPISPALGMKPIIVHCNRMKAFGQTKLSKTNDDITQPVDNHTDIDTDEDSDTSQFNYTPPKQTVIKSKTIPLSKLSPSSIGKSSTTIPMVPAKKIRKKKKQPTIRLPSIPSTMPTTTRSGRTTYKPLSYKI